MSRSDLLATIRAFWPMPTTAFIVVVTGLVGVPWLGILLLIAILFAKRWYWTCVYGLLNDVAVLGGILACLGMFVNELRDRL